MSLAGSKAITIHSAKNCTRCSVYPRACASMVKGNLAITSEMQCYNFPVRRLNGDFYAHVYPFDTKFYRKVHPAGALLFSGVHSHFNSYAVHSDTFLPTVKNPIWVISEVPKYWLECDGTMCLDEAHRWKSADAVAKRYRPWPKGLRTDSLPWFDSPLVQGASRLRYTDKAQMQRPGHTGRKALATKKRSA